METPAPARGFPARPSGTYRQGRVIKKPDVNCEIINQQSVIAQHRTCTAPKRHVWSLWDLKNALSGITAPNLPCFIWELKVMCYSLRNRSPGDSCPSKRQGSKEHDSAEGALVWHRSAQEAPPVTTSVRQLSVSAAALPLLISALVIG